MKAKQYFVSLSYMVEDKKTVIKIWLNLGLNLTFFRAIGLYTKFNFSVASPCGLRLLNYHQNERIFERLRTLNIRPDPCEGSPRPYVL